MAERLPLRRYIELAGDELNSVSLGFPMPPMIDVYGIEGPVDRAKKALDRGDWQEALRQVEQVSTGGSVVPDVEGPVNRAKRHLKEAEVYYS